MSAVVRVVTVTTVWVLLWGSVSAANVLGGLAVGAFLTLVLPRPRSRPIAIRPLAVARLALHVLWGATASNIMVARSVLSRRADLHTSVVDVPLPVCSDELLTLVANLLAITPGTMPLNVHENPRGLYVHVLHLGSLDDAKRGIEAMTEHCVRAFGSDAAIAAMEAAR